MEKYYDIVISCGSYFKPTLNGLMHGQLANKRISLTGDVTLNDVERIASGMAVSTYKEMVICSKEVKGFELKEKIANAFIFSNNELESAMSISFSEGRPEYEIYDRQQIDEMMKLTNYQR